MKLSSFLRYPLFSLGYFLKEIENIFFVFLSSYRNTRECSGELEKAVEALACGSSSHSISRSPKPITRYRNTEIVFYFLNNDSKTPLRLFRAFKRKNVSSTAS